MDHVIGLGEYKISNNSEDILKTYALASCVALTTYSPTNKTLGMVHIVLPDSNLNTGLSDRKPGYFADLAIPLLIEKTCEIARCLKDDLIIGVFGGANSIRGLDNFKIGERNVNETLRQLNDLGLKYHYYDTAGYKSRSLEIDVNTGTPKITYQKMTI